MLQFECEICHKSFAKNFNLKKHQREVHRKIERKTIRHIRKNRNVVCPVCNKEFTQHHNLKMHIIKSHESDEVLDKGIMVKQVVGELIDPKKADRRKTDFQ